MFFRLSLALHHAFALRPADSVVFEFGAPSQIQVRIYRPEPENPNGSEQVFCDAMSEREMSADLRRGFDALAADELPADGTIPNERLEVSVHQEDQFLAISLYSLIPPPLQQKLQQYASRIYDDLWEYARRTVSILRWRYNTIGTHDPYSFKGFYWSDDQINWKSTPLSGRVSVRDDLGFPTPNVTTRSEVVRLINEGKAEPLGHELFREAWEQRHQNPRSALVIGMAALDTGTRECIALLDPNLARLVWRRRSPSVMDLLIKYLPERASKFRGITIHPLPKRMSGTLRRGIELRNNVVHNRGAKFGYEQLEEILLCSRDILYMLDYICGFEWALRHMSDEMRVRLIKHS